MTKPFTPEMEAFVRAKMNEETKEPWAFSRYFAFHYLQVTMARDKGEKAPFGWKKIVPYVANWMKIEKKDPGNYDPSKYEQEEETEEQTETEAAKKQEVLEGDRRLQSKMLTMQMFEFLREQMDKDPEQWRYESNIREYLLVKMARDRKQKWPFNPPQMRNFVANWMTKEGLKLVDD